MSNNPMGRTKIGDQVPRTCFCDGPLEQIGDTTGRFFRCQHCQTELVVFVPVRGVVVASEIPTGKRLTQNTRPVTELTREYDRLALETRKIRNKFFGIRTQFSRATFIAIMVVTFFFVAQRTLSGTPLNGQEIAFVSSICAIIFLGLKIETARVSEIEKQYALYFVQVWAARRQVYEEKLASLSGQKIEDFQNHISKE